MSITNPYYRIVRFNTLHDWHPFVLDSKYADDRFVFVSAYHILEQDLKKLFEYVEPADANGSTYSHRIYELFLRASTELETNCKAILKANGYTKTSRWNIEDYAKVEQATRLSKYQVRISSWYPGSKILEPFKEWSDGHTLKWYQNYNDVKHDRTTNFALANLSNAVTAVAGVFAVLFAQFGTQVFNPHNEQTADETDNDWFYFVEDSLFSIKPFTEWTPNEQYESNWNSIKNSPTPFQQFLFK